jgi:hypothetical protein
VSVLLLHLTDLHIIGTTDPILTRAASIARCLNSRLPDALGVFIVLTGDIAMSGKKTEYDAAKAFLNNIVFEIKAQKDIFVEFLIVPGNHDCDFSGGQVVRNSILKDVLNHTGKMPAELVDALSGVQKDFFDFRNSLINPDSLVLDDRLWTIQEFHIEGKTIWFDSLNASWMSSIQEKPGTVLFPYEGYTEFKPTDADLRIGLIHHPLNWYHQSNYQGLRSFLHTLEDFLISGHEHMGNAGVRAEARHGECVFIEGSALQSHGKSGFNIVELRLDTSEFLCDRFEYEGLQYETQADEQWLPIRPLPNRIRAELQITSTFRDILSDPGATLHHPDKANLKLDDFYIFPDIDLQSSQRRGAGKRGALSKKKSARSLTIPEGMHPNVILEGDENAGKTRLLYQIYVAFHAKDYLPILIDGKKIKSSQSGDLVKLINAAVSEQYDKESIQAFERYDIRKKILLVDDFDQSPLQERFKANLYSYISKAFGARVLSVGENFGVGELFSGDKLQPLSEYIHYKILPFGYERRGDIVRKWNRLGITEVTSNNQWLSACSQAEQLIEAARLQHVATTVPIMVLSLLNLGSSGIAKEMHNSSFAHYFYFLIVGALSKAGVRQEALPKFLGFATHLSWYIKFNGIELEISEAQFRRFCESYSTTWTKVSASEMLDSLTESRLLKHHGDSIRFTYQYAYYYFLGRYTNLFIKDADVQAYLAFCMKNLYVRECANTLLFLAHHSENDLVLEGVAASLHDHLSDVAPVTFSKEDVLAISGLISNAHTLVYEKTDPVVHRTELEKFRDENDSGDDGLSSAPKAADKKKDFIDEITSISKTIEIAGALVTNQYASLSRDKKNYFINLIFDSSLKVIRGFYDIIGSEPELLVRELAARIKSKQESLSTSESEEITRQAIAWLLKLISMSFIEKAGRHLSSPDLSDNVDDVIRSNPTLAMQLIKISQQLSTEARLPQSAIKGIIRHEKDNPCVMSVLQLLVLQRLYMFDTEHDDKDWAISTFRLDGSSARIEFKDRQRRIDTRN